MNRAFRKWQRNRRDKKVYVAVAAAILNRHTFTVSDETAEREFARSLRAVDKATVEQLPGFLDNASNKPVATRAVLKIVYRGDDVADSLRILMTHFDYLIDIDANRFGEFGYWITTELVHKHRLHEWRLPEERAQDILDIIVSMQHDRKQVGAWITAFLVANPDKYEQVEEMLRNRDVTTLQDMEALLEDGTPMSLQYGAL